MRIEKANLYSLTLREKSKVKIRDGLGNEVVFSLNRPHTGINIPQMVWKDMYDFSEDSVLLKIM